MKTLNPFLLSFFALLLASQVSFAQANYKAGPNAGVSLTTGLTNTFVGASAGNKTNTGSYNSFYGGSSGLYNTSGKENSFFGSISGLFNTTGSRNSFFGYQAGAANTTASGNSFFGHQAGYKNTTGLANVFVGSQAGHNNTTGNHNSFIGVDAGSKNTTGGGNNFFGNIAGRNNTTGANNTFIGGAAGVNNTTASHNTFLGSGSGLKNSTGSRNTFLGTEAGWSITAGGDNTFIGYRAGYSSFASGTNNLAVGTHANVAGWTNATAIGHRAYVSTSNSLVLGAIANVNGATVSTNVGIGVHAPAYRLHVIGEAAKPGSSAWTVASDKRLKRDIKEFKDGLEIINQIKPVRYKYNGKAGMPTENEYIGVIAQEVEEVAPYMIHRFKHTDDSGKTEEYLDFDATALPFIIINAIKDQQQILEEKDAQLQTLIEELDSLKEEVEELRNGKAGKKEGAQVSGGNIGAASIEKSPRLLYNTPNPTTESTSISYELPSSDTQAHISIHSMTGEQMAHYDISGNTTGEVQVSAGSWKNGIYIYQLWVDGRMADSKRMLVNR